MDKINFLLSELEDMDKIIVFLNKESVVPCHTKKMIFRKEEINQFESKEIFKIDGYISRFDTDIDEDYILLNVPDIWFWDMDQKNISREEDFDLVFVPKHSILSIHTALETTIKRLVTELKCEK
ncbi:MAG: hypothetical protein KAS64_11440 [Spirochaetes bacterium]|nr:hypothetical protein [Spirochaetota bacterium]